MTSQVLVIKRKVRNRVRRCTMNKQMNSLFEETDQWAMHFSPLIRYNFKDPALNEFRGRARELVDAVCATAAFKRLEDIKFLGSLDYAYIKTPNGAKGNSRYTRAQHSIGVAQLAYIYADLAEHSESETLLAVAAALLHDVGHGPFSHSIEPLFKRKFGMDHHRATEEIILGRVNIGKELNKTLIEFGLDPLRVIGLMEGDDADFMGFFSGPINFDTVEGILRSREYLGLQNTRLHPAKVITAAYYRETSYHNEIVDEFWRCKGEMYNLAIRSERGVLYDLILERMLEINSDLILEEDFFGTESQLFAKIPLLRQLSMSNLDIVDFLSLLPSKIEYQKRLFDVEANASFFDRDDKARYVQSKILRSINV